MIVVVVSVVNNVGMAIKAAGEVGEEAKDVEDDPIMVVEVKDAEEVVDVVAAEVAARVEEAGVARKTKRSQPVPRNSTRPWMSIG